MKKEQKNNGTKEIITMYNTEDEWSCRWIFCWCH